MEIREYKPSDYENIKEWWKGHQWTPPTQGMLPATGAIVEGYCVGFLYKTDSEFAMFEFIVSNPNTSKEERSKALDLLIDTLVVEANKQGFKYIFTTSNHERLIERLVAHDFIVSDKNVTHVVRKV